jgi:hypothetical protein
MKTRHWTKVFNNLEGEVEYREGFPFTFQQLIDWGALNIKDKIEEISATAVE